MRNELVDWKEEDDRKEQWMKTCFRLDIAALIMFNVLNVFIALDFSLP
jgi:hypothetical protein